MAEEDVKRYKEYVDTFFDRLKSKGIKTLFNSGHA